MIAAKRLSFAVTVGLLILVCAAWTMRSMSQRQAAVLTNAGLTVSFGPRGLERLTYAGQVLEDVERYPADAFHIWHMSATDAGGQRLSKGDYGWGESARKRSWDASTKTWIYEFSWGRIRTSYEQSGDELNIRITEENAPGSGILFEGATLYPVALHMRSMPANLSVDSASSISDNVTAPGVSTAAFGGGEVAVVQPEGRGRLYSGFELSQAGKETGKEPIYFAMVSTTKPDTLKTGAAVIRPALLPGHSDSFVVSIRFAATGAGRARLAGDAYRSWAARWPSTLEWKDRRPIGTVYLASSPSGEKTLPEGGSPGFDNNPRRYFSEQDSDHFDVHSAAGLMRFQSRVLAQAGQIVANLRRLDAQGAITWDIEGEQYPQDTSYVCSPDLIGAAAPEMESTVLDKRSPLVGMKLDDAYFKMIRDAGFRVGVCVRPQHFTIGPDRRAGQRVLADAEATSELIRKMRYAHDRWGATLFYIDSTVGSDGATLDASVLEQAAAAVPDSLVIPEESSPRMYRATAPFQSFIFHQDLGTPDWVRLVYRHAFSVNLINDADAAKLAQAREQLINAVRQGDVLMVHAEYWQANDDTVMEIYRAAGKSAP